jgi:branched-chain amino acid aminotransferase
VGRVVYINGQFVPESQAKLSIYDLSVMQAAAAFEMTRSFNRKHFKLREHVERLLNSCALLSIHPPMTSVEWYEDLCEEVSERNDHGPGEEHRLLIVVSPGAAPIYKEIEGTINHPFVYIADFPLRYTVQGFSKYFTEGVHCVTSKVQQVPDACIPSAAKHRSRLHFHLAQQQAPAGTWPILTDGESLIEAPGANLVSVIPEKWSDEGEEMLPHFVLGHERDALPGISMQTVASLWGDQYESDDGLSEQIERSELWLTGTPFCMLPVVSLNGNPIGDGTIGPVFKATLRKWSELVGLDVAAQIIKWDQDAPLS